MTSQSTDEYTPPWSVQNEQVQPSLSDELRAIDNSLGRDANKHDRATVLIRACIANGVKDGPQIVAVLSQLGFNSRHIGKLLQDQAGTNPDSAWWTKAPGGKYENLHEWGI